MLMFTLELFTHTKHSLNIMVEFHNICNVSLVNIKVSRDLFLESFNVMYVECLLGYAYSIAYIR